MTCLLFLEPGISIGICKLVYVEEGRKQCSSALLRLCGGFLCLREKIGQNPPNYKKMCVVCCSAVCFVYQVLNSSRRALMFVGEGPRAHLSRLAECIRWSYGAGIVLRLGNIARLELNYCIPMGVQSGDRYIISQSERILSNSFKMLCTSVRLVMSAPAQTLFVPEIE